MAHAFYRVLIATIRDMGSCPCPRCKVKKSDLFKSGTTQDMQERRANVRKDDAAFRSKVKDARTQIFDHGYTIDSGAKVEPILKPESLVPTEVRPHVDDTEHTSRKSDTLLERVFNLLQQLCIRVRCVLDAGRRSDARIRVGSMEGTTHTPHPNTLCYWAPCCEHIQQQVSPQVNLVASNNMPVKLSDMYRHSDGQPFTGSSTMLLT